MVYLIVLGTIRSPKNRTVLEVQVKSVGYDYSLGGHSFDLRLQLHLAKLFSAKFKTQIPGGDVSKDSRAMARLLKEANRVKQILSANTETFATIESLVDNLDLKFKVTRKELEEMTQVINYEYRVIR